jgi:hypothetical protein
MAQGNRYYRSSKLSEAKFRQLVRCFAENLTGTESAKRTGVSVRSVNPIFMRIRRRINELSKEELYRKHFGNYNSDEFYKFSCKYYGDNKKHYGLSKAFKETDMAVDIFRFFNRNNLYKALLEILEENPL